MIESKRRPLGEWLKEKQMTPDALAQANAGLSGGDRALATNGSSAPASDNSRSANC